MGGKFAIEKGVRQGDPFSPNLFNRVLEEIFRNLNWENKGLAIKKWGDNLFEYTRLNNLRFADDIVLIARNEKELEGMAEDLRRESNEMGLTMNLTKTKIMSNIKNLNSVELNGTKIESVKKYRYLGQILSTERK